MGWKETNEACSLFQEALMKKYPWWNGSEFSIMPGWFPLVARLAAKLNKLERPEGFQFLQIKEKFAAIRIYVQSSTSEIKQAIDEAEQESVVTCEVCGKSGSRVNTGYWLHTLCETHDKDRSWKD